MSGPSPGASSSGSPAADVEVQLPPGWRPLASGSDRVRVRGASVGEVIRRLAREVPALADRLLTRTGAFRPGLVVFLNGTDVRYLDRERTLVAASDTLMLVPSLAGG